MGGEIKYLVFTDLHHGNIMPDCKVRLEQIIEAAYDHKVDFIMNLGDFAWPCEENRWIVDRWNHLDIPHYIAIGNHDLDCQDKETFKKFYNLESTYYSFEDDYFHYVVLDTNYFRHEGEDYDYAYGNYYGKKREYICKEQLEWIRNDVSHTQKPCILFSHAQLHHGTDKGGGGCGNYKELHDLLLSINKEAGWQKICAAINGHNHTDSYENWDDIHHIDINSASNQWLGEEYAPLVPNQFYNTDIHSLYPYLKYVAPYKEPLYAIITLDTIEHTLAVQGKETSFIGASPKERGHEGTMGGIPITPKISNLYIKLY